MPKNRQNKGRAGRVLSAKTSEDFELALDTARSYFSRERGSFATRNATLLLALEYALAKGLQPMKFKPGRNDGSYRAGVYSFRAPPDVCQELDAAYPAFSRNYPSVSVGPFARQLTHRGLIAYSKSRSTLLDAVPIPIDDDSSSLNGAKATLIGYNTSVTFLNDVERAGAVIEQQEGMKFDPTGLQRLLLVRALTYSIPVIKSPSAHGGIPATTSIRLNEVVFNTLRRAHQDYQETSGETVRLGAFARWLVHAGARHRASRTR